jgi:hypothetical protein
MKPKAFGLLRSSAAFECIWRPLLRKEKRRPRKDRFIPPSQPASLFIQKLRRNRSSPKAAAPRSSRRAEQADYGGICPIAPPDEAGGFRTAAVIRSFRVHLAAASPERKEATPKGSLHPAIAARLPLDSKAAEKPQQSKGGCAAVIASCR